MPGSCPDAVHGGMGLAVHAYPKLAAHSMAAVRFHEAHEARARTACLYRLLEPPSPLDPVTQTILPFSTPPAGPAHTLRRAAAKLLFEQEEGLLGQPHTLSLTGLGGLLYQENPQAFEEVGNTAPLLRCSTCHSSMLPWRHAC